MQQTWVQSLGQEDPPKKEMALHSSILAWEIPWTGEPGRLQSMGSQGVGHDLAIKRQLRVRVQLYYSKGTFYCYLILEENFNMQSLCKLKEIQQIITDLL